jgi:hypothetical protein
MPKKGNAAMALYNGKVSATLLAIYVRYKLSAVPYGTLLIRAVADGNLIAAVFGNESYLFNDAVKRQVELIRYWIRDSGTQELGFGISPDGHSWAMLIHVDHGSLQTVAGKTFHAEMFQCGLDDAVRKAWHTACGITADGGALATQENPQLA